MELKFSHKMQQKGQWMGNIMLIIIDQVKVANNFEYENEQRESVTPRKLTDGTWQ